jgi:D-sedoheptulose 7-phosphate isomerase
MSYKEKLISNIENSIEAKKTLLKNEEMQGVFEEVVDALIKSFKSGGRLYIAGNGGSAADAQHLAAEFISKLAKDRGPLPAEALTVDSSTITAIGNDYGFEHIFSRQLAAKAHAGDIFLGISTSGNSTNIIRALTTCKEIGVPTVLLTGVMNSKAQELATWVICSPAHSTAGIQELHILIEHTMCELVEKELFFDTTYNTSGIS